MSPFFSVIIPLYNKEKYLEKTIQSLVKQLFKDFEVIVVNDGSTDNSLNVLERLIDDRFLIFNQKNQGASQARNMAIEKAMGKYIALLDADDLWHENHLNELKKLIENFPNAGLFCNNYEINYNGKFVKPAIFNLNNQKDECIIVKDYFKSSIINSIAWTSSVAFSKDNFNEIGRFNESLRTGQDIDLWIRFALKYDVAFNPKITMQYSKIDPSALSKSIYNNDRYKWINNYTIKEKQNKSLNIYLDINRYALAIKSKLNNEIKLYNKLMNQINLKNLNFKQRILLKLPRTVLHSLKRLQEILMKKKIYLTPFK